MVDSPRGARCRQSLRLFRRARHLTAVRAQATSGASRRSAAQWRRADLMGVDPGRIVIVEIKVSRRTWWRRQVARLPRFLRPVLLGRAAGNRLRAARRGRFQARLLGVIVADATMPKSCAPRDQPPACRGAPQGGGRANRARLAPPADRQRGPALRRRGAKACSQRRAGG